MVRNPLIRAQVAPANIPLTIDININYCEDNITGDFSKIIIAEVKQERMSRSSDFIRIAKDLKIYPMRLSKYCITTMQMDDSVKKNRFKDFWIN